MANYFEAGAGDEITLSFNNILKDGSITVTAKVYDKDDSQVGSNISLAHVADGLYTNKYTVPTGNDVLTVFYIPSGDDNATSIDQIKVRNISPFGRASASISDGINDDDIKVIIKALKKELPKEREIDLIPIENKLNELLGREIKIPSTDLTSINRSIDSKMTEIRSEISKLTPLVRITNSLNDKVSKINLKELNSLSSNISSLKSEVKSIPQSVSLMQNEIKDARNELLNIKVPTDDIQELILKSDELQLARFEKLQLSLLSILKRLASELKNNNGNFGKTLKEVEALKQTLAIFNLNTLRNEVL